MSHSQDTTPPTDEPSGDARKRDARESDGIATRSLCSSDTGSGHLEVRCPNCHAPSEIAVDTRLTDLTCSACGSHFSLVDQSQETRMAPSLTQMGRFELIERLGVGGFGSVWKARDKDLDRTVAIKIPRQGSMTADEQEKFFREARAAAQLRHPGIVSVHEVGRDGESVYIVSDFVRGVTLGDWLTGQKLTSREAAELTAKIADALHHAHEQGVVHRDLKPANVIMDIDNEPHLMDFGLARRDVGEVTVTMDGQVLGTPAYMSPEQAQGEGHRADRRSDVYSLGVILFQLLTGELPFRGNARMLVHQVIRDEPPSPRKLNSNVPKDLETITLKCLEKDAANRYHSAHELAMELRRFLSKEPIKARPISRFERGWRWCKRNPAVAALSAVLLLGLVSISTIAPAIAARQASLRRNAQHAEAAARDEAERAAREAERSQRLADFVGAKYSLSQGRLRDAYQQITSAIKSQPSWEYGRILGDIVDQSRRDWQLLQRIPSKSRAEWGCFVGPGPKWIVFSSDGQLEVRSLVREHPVATAHIEGESRLPCAVGSERLAASTGPGTITLYSIPDLRVLATCQFPGKVIEIRSNAKGNYFVAVNDQAFVRVFDHDGQRRAEKQFTLSKNEVSIDPIVDISPSGRAVMFDPSLYSDDKIRWFWESDEVTKFKLRAHQSRLRDDDTAWGVWVNTDNTSSVWITGADVRNSREQTLFYSDDFIYSTRAALNGVGSNRGLGGLTLISDQGINVLRAPDQAWKANDTGDSINERMTADMNRSEAEEAERKRINLINERLAVDVNAVRYESIWPHSSDSPRFLAYDDVTRTLALSTNSEILLFTRWLPNTLGASLDLNALFWSLDVAGDNAMVMYENVLQIVDLRSLEQRQIPLSVPEPDEGKTFLPWGIASTPDSRWAAILWQESDRQGTIGSRYFRKRVRVYQLPASDSEEAPRMVGDFALDDYFGMQGRSNRELWLSPDATTVAFCSADCLLSAYRVADGAQLYKTRIPNTLTFAKCADPPLLGAGDASANGEYRVWNVVTGKLVAHFPLAEEVGRSAFARDGKSVYIGTMSDGLRQFRLSDAAILSQVKTSVLPVSISPTGNRYLGFAPDTPTLGSLVLVDLNDGRTLDVVNPTTHILSDGFFSNDGRTFAFMLNRFTFRAMKSLDIPEANHWLQYAAIEPQLAVDASDFLDYRERLAARHIAAGNASLQEKRRSVAWDKYRLAQHIIEGMVDDFPNTPRYEAMLARNCEQLATFDAELIRRTSLLERARSIRRQLARTAPDLNLESTDPAGLNELAWVFATSPDDAARDGQRAVKLATKACELTSYTQPIFVDTLAAAHAEAGDFDAATKWSEEAIKLLNDNTSEEVKTAITRALEDYKSKKPTRQPPPDGAENPKSQPPADTTSPAAT